MCSCQLRCPKVSKGRAESPLVRPQAHTLCPGRGWTRRLRRGSRACSPMGRSHFSFDGKRKVCKRKPAARRLREKALYCPFCRRGSLCRAQHDWPDFTCDPARSELAFFRRQNGRAFFPPLPIAALAPAVGVRHTQALPVEMFQCGLDIFATQNASVVSNPRWLFSASHEARCRMAVYIRQHTGNRTRPASRGTRRATAVIPRPSGMSR